MLAPLLYRVASRLMLGPVSGASRIRRAVIDASSVEQNVNVLELGCGPGLLTQHLVNAGARVHAVELSREMLDAARRRAPTATFEQADVRQFDSGSTYDVIILSYVLHELPASELPVLLDRWRTLLRDNGRLVVLDHALPNSAWRSTWLRILRMVEGRTIDEWLDVVLRRLIESGGTVVTTDSLLGGGRARLIVAQPNRPAA